MIAIIVIVIIYLLLLFIYLFYTELDWLINWLADWLIDWLDDFFPSLLQSLLVLVGFIAVIPSASGISCYVKDCMYFPDGDPYCRYDGLVDCLEEDDGKCGTLSFTLGSNYRAKVWNCTRSTHDGCNEEVTCNRMRELAIDIDDTIESCAVTCCDGDGCNDPGEIEEHVYIVNYAWFMHGPIFFFTLCIAAQKDFSNHISSLKTEEKK